MNFILLFFVMSFAVSSVLALTEAESQALLDGCDKEFGVTGEDLKKDPVPQNLKCSTACFFKKMGYITENGELGKMITEDHMLHPCTQIRETDICELAFQLENCMAHVQKVIADAQQKAFDIRKKCGEEVGIPVDDVQFKSESPTQAQKCAAACFAKKSGFITEDGQFHSSLANHPHLKNCILASGSDQCDIAYKFAQCAFGQ